jgi:hypothetical protein
MRSILGALKRIGSDILAFRNIEAYVIAALAIALAVAGVLNDALPQNWLLAVLLAGVSLLVFKSTEPESKIIDLDSVLQSRQSYGPFREFIRGGHTLWVYGPSAVTVMSQSPDIQREILEKGGQLRVILQNPQTTATMDMLHRQLDQMHRLLEMDIERSLHILRRMSAEYKVEHRLLDDCPGFSIVIIDPDRREGRLVVEFFGFNSDLINDRMHIEISRQQSNYWFDYWVRQYEKMWDTAQPDNHDQ